MLLKITTAIALLASFVAAAAVPCNDQGDIIDNCNIQGTVALTFDDGPKGDGSEKKIAQAIQAQGGSATFYLNGNNYGCIYDDKNVQDIRWLFENGFELGSHTWSHANVAQLSRAQIVTELDKIETAFIKILGVKPRTFRPPYGELSETARQVLIERGYTKILKWSDDSGDSVGASTAAQKAVMQSVANSYPNPHLVLQHSTISSTANDVTYFAAPLLKQKGYKMTTVAKCLTNGGNNNDKVYQYVGGYGTRDSSWKC